jgi:hypothetical protein
MKPPRWPASGRVLVVLLIMLDALRRILDGETRPVDVLMLVIELLILLLILLEFAWKVVDWWREKRETKQRERDINVFLGSIDNWLADSSWIRS